MAVTTTNSRIEEGVLVLTLPENLGSGTVVTRIGTDTEGETVDRVYLYGTHRSLFEVNADNEIVFKGTAQDFEAMPADFSLSLQVVTVNDETGRPTTHTLKNVVVRVADVDEAPTGLTVTGVTDQLNEGEYTSGVKLAEIVVEDDALGTNTLAALPAGSPFEYRSVTRAGAELWLRAGTELDREAVDSLVASIAVDGTTLAATHTLTVLDVNDTDPVIGIGGSRVSLAEGVYGAETDTGIRLTVTDADLNDTAEVRIADDRFSVRGSDGAVLIVAGSEFDREAMPLTFVSTLVTAEDAAGNLGQRYLFVDFVDRNDTDPVFGGTGRVEVEENSGAGMVVYDPDVTPDVAGDAVAHSLSGPDAASFTIDAASGELTLTGDPDYESKAVYIVTVTAETRAGKADARSASQHVVVRVRDGNDLPPHIEPVAVAEVAEGSGAGQVVHTPVAAVPDVAGDSVEYTLGGADAGAFTIDGETGALTLTGDPDFEEKSFYTVTITAVTRAGADDEQSAAQSVTLLVLDRPGDELALSASGTQQDLPEGAYTEAAPTGITFGVEGRADLSGIRFRVDDTRFVVGADGGLSVAAGAEFDHEDVADRSIELTVTARDGQGNSGEVVVTVEISNANDEAPEITSQAEGGALDENTEVAAGGVVYRASGTFDATDIAWGIKGGDSALFEMDAATGEVTASSALTPDHEVKSAYGFTLVADSGGLMDELEVVIPVVDLNDHGPRFVKPNKAHLLLRIRENTGAERSLTKLETAPDVEGDAVAYRLIGPGAADFRIDTDTGALLLVPNPDHETMRLHYVQVRAVTREGEDDEQYNDLWVRVDIVNLDDTAPVIARSGTQAALSEGVFAAATPTGYTYSATDADNIGSLTFSVDSDAFEVLADGRLVVVAGAEIDHEALGDGKLPIVVTVTDGAGHTDSDSLDIAIADVDEATLEITSAGTATALDENTVVASTDMVYAAAGVATGDAAISWSLKGGDAPLFAIGASSGEVRFRAATTPDHEARASYTFTVVAVSGELVEEIDVTVPVKDLNDNPPAFTATGAAEVVEETGAGQVVYTPEAAVPDVEGDAVVYRLSGADSGHFTIDGASGALTLTANPDYETRTSYSVVITAVTRDGGDDERSAAQAVTVSVTDVTGSAPEISRTGEQAALSEGLFPQRKATGYTYTATDADAGDTLTFSASDARFLVTASGGLEIRAGSRFDHEGGDGRLTVTVRVTDSEGNADSDAVVVAFADVNDEGPRITSDDTGRTLPENTGVGTGEAIYTAKGTYDVAPITWSISGTDSARLDIDSTSGEVAFKVATTPDHEAKTDYTFTVRADSGGRTDELEVTVPVTDLNDNPPKFNTTGSAKVKQDAAAGTEVYTPAAATPDVAGDAVLYRLSGPDSGDFTIDENTGALTLREKADEDYSVVITAVTRENRSDQQSAEQVVTIDLDLPDNRPPKISRTGSQNTLKEGTFTAKATTETGYVYSATDPDKDDTLTFSVSDGRFDIDPDTGRLVILKGKSFDLEAGKDSVAVKVTVTDKVGNTDDDTVDIKFELANSPPTISRTGSQNTLKEGTFTVKATTETGYVYSATDPDKDDTLTFSVSDARFAIDPDTGNLVILQGKSFDHEAGEGSVEVKVTVTDSAGNTDEDTVDITFKDVNDEDPEITSDPTGATLDENTEVGTELMIYTATGTPDLTPITWSISGADSSRLDIDSTTGVVTFKAATTPDHEARSAYIFTVRADSGGLTDTLNVMVQVKDLNDNPPAFAATGAAEVVEETGAGQVVYTPEAAVPDVEGDAVVYRLSGADSGHFTIDGASGALTLTANPDYETRTSYSVVITAVTRDGGDDERSAAQAVTVSVTDVTGSAPEISRTGEQAALSEGLFPQRKATGYTYTATDADAGDTLTFSASDARFLVTASGGLEIRAGSRFDHEGGDGRLTVTVRVTDSEGNADSDAVVVAFADVNDEGPRITSDDTGRTLPENTGVGTGEAIYTAKGTYDVAPITWSISGTDSARLDIDSTSGEVAFKVATTPDHEAKTDYTFTVRADSGGRTDELEVTVPVTDLNDNPPKFNTTGSAKVKQDAAAGTEVYTPAAATPDVAGDAVLYRLSGPDSGDFTIDENTGALTLREKADEDYSVVITAVTRENRSDQQSAEQVVTIDLDLPDNRPPKISRTGSQNTLKEGTFTAKATTETGYVYSATDPDKDDTLTFSVSDGRFAIDPGTGNLVILQGKSFDHEAGEGSVAVKVTVTDRVGNTDEDTVNITFGDVNDENPEITSGDKGAPLLENTGVGTDKMIYTATGTYDVTPITWSISGEDSARLDIDSTSGKVTFKVATTPDYEAGSAYTFTVQADSGGLTDTLVVKVPVLNVNEPPVPKPIPDQTTNEDATWQFKVPEGTFEDPDGDELILSATSSDGGALPGWLSFDDGEMTLSGHPQQAQVGDHFIKITAKDRVSNGLSAHTTLKLTVENMNDPPQLSVPSTMSVDEGDYSVQEDTVTGFKFGVEDEDPGDTHTFSKTGGDARLTVRESDGALVIVKGAKFDHEAPEHSVSLEVTVTDREGATDKETVTVTINDKNDGPPDFPTSQGTFKVDENATGDALGFDIPKAVPDVVGDGVSYELADTGDDDDFSLKVTGGAAQLVMNKSPDHESKSSYSVVIRATTRKGADDEQSATLPVTVNVQDINDHGPTLHTHFDQTFAGGAANSSGLHTVNGWSRMFTMTGKADVEGDTIVWSLKNGNTDELKVTENGEVWLATAKMSTQHFNTFGGNVVASVGNYTSEAYLFVSYGSPRPFFSEEDSDTEAGEDSGQENDSGESDGSGDGTGEDGDDNDEGDTDDDGNNSDSSVGPTTAFVMDDGYF